MSGLAWLSGVFICVISFHIFFCLCGFLGLFSFFSSCSDSVSVFSVWFVTSIFTVYPGSSCMLVAFCSWVSVVVCVSSIGVVLSTIA